MTETDATTPEPTEADATASPAPEAPVDDVKEQMRLALEAKHGRHGTAASGTSPDKAGKADSHARGKSQRTFRRKSGSA